MKPVYVIRISPCTCLLYTSLALAFALFHALILLGDRYIGYSPATLLLPFASHDYRPISVGPVSYTHLDVYKRQGMG